MMYASLVVAATLLLTVNLIAWRAKHPTPNILATAFLFVFLFGFLFAGITLLPPVLLQALLIAVITPLSGVRHGKWSSFALLSCGASVVAFAVPGYFAYRQTKHLQEAFSYRSMENRLPLRGRQGPLAPLPADTSKRLDEMETLIEKQDEDWTSRYRRDALRQIHEETVRMFINQRGFGMARMIGVSEERLTSGAYQRPPIPQPGTPSASPWLPDQLQPQPLEPKTREDLLSLHRWGVVDFVNLPGLGYVKDRRHVAGFLEHQVREAPQPAPPWRIQVVDLLGLLLHEKAVVYVSENMPRMDELRAAPTRELDSFEATGLPTLQGGEDLYVRERGKERRMLGSIRAARQCLVCHEGERGDLLGAFSYRMTQDSK